MEKYISKILPFQHTRSSTCPSHDIFYRKIPIARAFSPGALITQLPSIMRGRPAARRGN
jgi:hypothetical protein